MPNFLNPWIAAGAAAIVIPSLLLLYFLKLRRREVVVPSTLLWKKAVQDLQVNAPFQKLRRNLLLLLQLLLLLLLTLALARPVISYAPGAGKLSVIIIDRSASMSATDMPESKSRIDEAKRLAREFVESIPKDGTAMVIAADESAEIIRTFTSDKALLKQAIDSIQSTHRKSTLKQAFQLAEAKAASFNPEQRRPGADGGPKPQVMLYSDGRAMDRNDLALRFSDLTWEKIGTEQAGNIAIVSLSAKRNYEQPGQVQVFVRLANFGPEPVKAVVQMTVDNVVPPGGVRSGLTLLPERWTPAQRQQAEKQGMIPLDGAEFQLELMKGAVIQIELKEQEKDALAADDAAAIVVPPPRALNMLLVTRGNYPLERFAEIALVKAPGIVPPITYEQQMADPQKLASEYDVIVFDRYQPKAIPPAGNFIYFNAVPPDSTLTVAASATGGLLTQEYNSVLDWNRAHPILRGLNIPFGTKESLQLKLPLNAETLIEGRKGPLMVLHREGRSTHMVFPFDVIDTDWAFHPTFPVVMDRALQFLALGSDMDVRQSYQPGASPRIPRYNLQQAGGDLKQITLHRPGRLSPMTVNVPATGDFALPSLDYVGVYRTEPQIPQYEQIAVNLLDDNESNLLLPEKPPVEQGQVQETAAKGKSRLELWWWIIACAALPLLLVEWWVYTRRMHI